MEKYSQARKVRDEITYPFSNLNGATMLIIGTALSWDTIQSLKYVCIHITFTGVGAYSDEQ